MNEITRILDALEEGQIASDKLWPALYTELRHLAGAKMTAERPDHTLQPTALVHEAWLRLVDSPRQSWQNRAHFFSAAAEAMRRILIEHARRKLAQRRGAGASHLNIDEVEIASPVPGDGLLAIDEALEQFAALEPRQAELVKLRYFAGLTIEEAAQILGISVATANRWWTYARAWLFHEVNGKKRSQFKSGG